jgi:hypothetical protein
MARFRYRGTNHDGGRCELIRFHHGEDGLVEVRPSSGTHHENGADIGVDVTDERALRHFRIDPRFEEIK